MDWRDALLLWTCVALTLTLVIQVWLYVREH